ncbi:hypothetical protein OG311_31925 [Streptomyces sp. NBC_01343]|uniref:hypothetical protein n=1 Tax=Streptomyces sp. NBC_01343 TaxID=2903832 RepID=UPI002E0EF75B|nr:hypothetical protein OG311_31925 [Streptomyces sp. NBC_01343]
MPVRRRLRHCHVSLDLRAGTLTRRNSYRGHRDIRIRFRPGRLGISVPSSHLGPVPLVLRGDRHERIAAGQERWFRLPKG